VIQWASTLGLETYVDPVGNLLIRKVASKGWKHRATGFSRPF